MRAEILGAFFNAVFLIALCLSIVLEAVTRLIDPPEISNPQLILIVGCLGLASNLAGFLVLGGHGHSHGPEGEEHGHSHDEIGNAEEGHAHGHSHSHITDGAHDHADEFAHPGEIFPEAVIAKARNPRKIDFSTSDDTETSPLLARNVSKASKKHRRRTSSIHRNRLQNIDSIHPSSFRQDIIAASQMDGIQSEESSSTDDDPIVYNANQNPVEISGPNSKQHNGHDHSHSHGHDHNHEHQDSNKIPSRPRHNSWHENHNHKKPKKAAQGHGGHNHADMGMRAMILHVAGDALGNVGVIVSALVIWLTSSPYRFYADPAVSLFITMIILHSTLPLTKATAKILLQATPDHLDVKDIKEDIQGIPGVVSCHHVHIWQLSDSQVIASMHIQVSFPLAEDGGSERYMELAKAARECLHAYGIHSATIQPEFCLDKAHIHSAGLGGDATGDTDSDDCLLECVDDCKGKGCCAPAAAEAQHDHGSHDGHTH